eukprot:jgi/Ulvmu1/4059/UM019_0036.1
MAASVRCTRDGLPEHVPASALFRKMTGALYMYHRKQKALLRARLWLASNYGCTGFLMPYYNLILAHFGYNGWQIGVVSALRPFAAALCGPLWAAFADSKKSHKAVLITCLIISSVARASLGVLAHPFWYLITLALLAECVGSPISALSDAAVMAASTTDGCYGTCRMWACVTYNASGVISSFLMHVSGDSALFVSYAAAALLAIVSAARLDTTIDQQRDSLDSAPMSVAPPGRPPSLAGGQVATHYCGHVHSESDCETAEPLLPVTCSTDDSESPTAAQQDASNGFMCLDPENDSAVISACGSCGELTSRGPPASAVAGLDDQDWQPAGLHDLQPDSASFSEKLSLLLRDPRVLAFLATALLMGVCGGAIDGYLFVYLDELKAPPLLMGSCLAVICCAEVPVFAFSGRILHALGYQGALRAGLAAYCVRLFAYSCLRQMPSLWFILPVELLHGVTFGVAWCGGVNLCNSIAPAGLESTAQSLFSGMYAGMGRGVGGLAGGLLLHHYGGMHLFRWLFYTTVSSWGLILLFEHAVLGKG